MTESRHRRPFVVGGAGFIGGHFVERLLGRADVEQLTIYDNFSSGRRWHLENVRGDSRLNVVEGDVKDLGQLAETMRGHDVVIHLASNPDIARAMREPTIDFDEGTALTNNVVEAMRMTQVSRILYASGSGVYGDVGSLAVDETYGPLVPVSTYGASKLAGEALIASYCHMFEMSGLAFRFGNVVGPRQTHGVGYDFVLRLLQDGRRLRILGDGAQTKPYIHVDDVITAVLLASESTSGTGFGAFNVATDDYVSVLEIADLSVQVVVGPSAEVPYDFTGGDRGWRGDVPVVRLETVRIRALGWQPVRSGHQAIFDSLTSIHEDAVQGRFQPVR